LQGFQISKKKQFDNKIIALIDANTISYGESIAGILKHYSIATFIGENTAGTNGDMNIIDLPGGYLITFTGMLVTLPDGTKLNGLGIEPNIFAEQKIILSI
jgi:C-terminal processing protease CtpA/Prc